MVKLTIGSTCKNGDQQRDREARERVADKLEQHGAMLGVEPLERGLDHRLAL
jgi:hypothetical protein